MKQQIRDRRRLPFFQVTKADLAALSKACDAPNTTVRLSSARSVYFALLEATNDERSDTAEVTRKELAERSGVSTRTVYDVVQVIETAGLLEVEKTEGHADTWVLISTEGRQSLPGGVGSDCRGGRQSLPGSIYREDQEGEKTPSSPPQVTVDQVREVFEFWQRACGHPGAELDEGRARVINRALRFATVEECKRAIVGCSRSDFHMARGKHKGDRRQDHLSLILRNRENIERFMEGIPVTAGQVDADGFTSSAHDARIREHKRNVLRANDLAGSAEALRSGDESERWLDQHGIRVVRTPGERPTFAGPDEPGR